MHMLSVPNQVTDIGGLSIPAEITRSVVVVVAVNMAGHHARWPWPYEGFEHQRMDSPRLSPAFGFELESQISD